MRAIWTVLMRSVHRPQHRNSTVMLNPTKCMFRPWQGGSRSRRCRPGRCPRIGPHTLPVRCANRTGTAGWTRHNISSRILKPSLIMEKKSLSQISSKASHACKTHRCASDMELEPAKAGAPALEPVLVGNGPRCHALRLANLIQLCDHLRIHLGPKPAGVSSFARPQPHLLAATTVNEDAAAVGLATTSLRNAYSIQKSVTLKLLHLLPCAS